MRTKHHASGPFDVKLTPQAPIEGADAGIGHLLLDKQFHGDLEATSKGQMLALRTDIPSSAGYVAIERVSGTLQGRAGSFALQHSGTMNRGAASLVVNVVPDSGTGALEGLSGAMKIAVADGKHSYELEYEIETSA